MSPTVQFLAHPGLAVCEICTEEVHSLKVLPCHHAMCTTCLSKLIRTAQAELCCPQCRRVFSPHHDGFRTKFFGRLSCDNCLELKDVQEFWWCCQCKKALCSLCAMKDHRFPHHEIYQWDDLYPVDFCQGVLDKSITEGRIVQKRNVEKLQKLFEPIFNDVARKIAVERRGNLKEANKTLGMNGAT